MRHYFGWDLSARDIPLNFELPRPSERVKASLTTGTGFYQGLREARENPAEYFRVLRSEISLIGRCALKQRQRLALNRKILGHFFAEAEKQIIRQSKHTMLPDSEERARILNDIIDISHLLMMSYQIIFSTLYVQNNFRYARGHAVVLESSSLIFELLILKQRARALRYQLLTDRDWQLANTLFYVMSSYEDVTQPTPFIKKYTGADRNRCLREQFALLHIVAKFDMLRWPTNLQWIIANYIQGDKESVSVQLSSQPTKTDKFTLVTQCYSQTCAVSSLIAQAGSFEDKSIELGCGRFFSSIQNDCLRLFQAKLTRAANEIPERFSAFSESDHFVISNQLLMGMENSPASQPDDKEIELEDLRIYVGFSSVFALFKHRQGRRRSEQRLADLLALRSAAFAEDHKSHGKSQWLVVAKNEKMMRLRTQESSQTTAMAIGSLVAYSVQENSGQPVLAVISRIYRPSYKVVEIDFYDVANYAEAVMLKNENSHTEKQTSSADQPALLVRKNDRSKELDIIMAPQSVLIGFDQFQMRREEENYSVGLTKWRNATPNFYHFSTALDSEALDLTLCKTE